MSRLILLLPFAILAACQNDTPTVRTPSQPGLFASSAQFARATGSPQPTASTLEPVALFSGPIPTGIAVSDGGRTFVCFPRWSDPVAFTVAEIRSGQAVPYPDARINRLVPSQPSEHLLSVQSVVIDPANRLWILDTGSINFQRIIPSGPKLLCVDLRTNSVIKKIQFPPDVALSTSYLNDVRFDLRRGAAGYAFITDSSDQGPNAIIVVNLDTGQSLRRLNDHPSTKAQPNFTPTVESQPLLSRPPNAPAANLRIGADGLAISPDGQQLFFCPLAGRHLYSISVDALIDPNRSESQLAQSVIDLGDKGFASDGLESDSQGNLYLTDYEHNAIQLRDPNGVIRVLVQDPRLIWPDSLSLAANGYLYITANQLNRQPRFHQNRDLRQPPYVLFRTLVNTQPLRTTPTSSASLRFAPTLTTYHTQNP